jgi:hypothetical protein
LFLYFNLVVWNLFNTFAPKTKFKQNQMKKLLITIALMLSTIGIHAQQYSVRRDAPIIKTEQKDSVSHSFEMAGKFIRRSAIYDYTAIGLGIASAIAYSGMITDNTKAKDTAGTFLAAAAIASKVVSISLRNKAGRELTLSPTGIKYTF